MMSFSVFLSVDDGTGVINCLCWKGELLKDKDDGSKSELIILLPSET